MVSTDSSKGLSAIFCVDTGEGAGSFGCSLAGECSSVLVTPAGSSVALVVTSSLGAGGGGDDFFGGGY